MTDFEANRTVMVDTQVRPSDVTKFPIIDAMLSVRREAYVPASKREVAYVDANIALSANRIILEPRSLAKMLDALDIQQGDMVLNIGAGLGYSAAILSRMAEAVIAVEEDPDMAREAEDALAEQGADNVVLHEATLTDGAPKHGPYDAILIEGAVEQVPQSVIEQLKEGGRIAAIFANGRHGECRIGTKLDGSVSWRMYFNAGAPVLPGFEAKRAFAL